MRLSRCTRSARERGCFGDPSAGAVPFHQSLGDERRCQATVPVNSSVIIGISCALLALVGWVTGTCVLVGARGCLALLDTCPEIQFGGVPERPDLLPAAHSLRGVNNLSNDGCDTLRAVTLEALRCSGSSS